MPCVQCVIDRHLIPPPEWHPLIELLCLMHGGSCAGAAAGFSLHLRFNAILFALADQLRRPPNSEQIKAAFRYLVLGVPDDQIAALAKAAPDSKAAPAAKPADRLFALALRAADTAQDPIWEEWEEWHRKVSELGDRSTLADESAFDDAYRQTAIGLSAQNAVKQMSDRRNAKAEETQNGLGTSEPT